MKDTFDMQNPWRKPGHSFHRQRYIKRGMFDTLMADIDKKRINVLLGARQVGKTFLIKRMIQRLIESKSANRKQIFYFNFDAFVLHDLFKNQRAFLNFIKAYGKTGKKSYIFLDGAQRIAEVGLLLKQYYDLISDLELDIKFIVSGSSSLQIKSQVKETLTGRKKLLELYPVSYDEFLRWHNIETPRDPAEAAMFDIKTYQRHMAQFVVFGGYPDVVAADDADEKISLLKEIYSSYVRKDISEFLKIEDIAGFNRLVRFLAAQNTALCKINEIAKNVRLSRHYVEKYITSLEETYVASRLSPFFANFGKAIIKAPKLYFCDPGLRNTVFGEFQSLENRTDAGALVENFIFSELLKSDLKEYIWFYRTTAGSEIDFIIAKNTVCIPVEVKQSIGRQQKIPKIFGSSG